MSSAIPPASATWSPTCASTTPLPTATLTSPGANIRGTAVAMNATVVETGSGVSTVEYQWSVHNANTWTTFDTKSTTSSTGTLNTTTLGGDGFYDLRVRATDLATNVGLSTIVSNVRVDNTVPTVTLAGVAGDTSVRETLSLTAAPADTGGSGVSSVTYGRRLRGLERLLHDHRLELDGPGYGVSFNTTALNGLYEIQALATDVAGNTASNSVTNVLIDNTRSADARQADRPDVGLGRADDHVRAGDRPEHGRRGLGRRALRRVPQHRPDADQRRSDPGGRPVHLERRGRAVGEPGDGHADLQLHRRSPSTPPATRRRTRRPARDRPRHRRPHRRRPRSPPWRRRRTSARRSPGWRPPRPVHVDHYHVYRDGVQIDRRRHAHQLHRPQPEPAGRHVHLPAGRGRRGNATFGARLRPGDGARTTRRRPRRRAAWPPTAALDGSVVDRLGCLGRRRRFGHRALRRAPLALLDARRRRLPTATRPARAPRRRARTRRRSTASSTATPCSRSTAPATPRRPASRTAVTARDQTAPAVPTGLSATPGRRQRLAELDAGRCRRRRGRLRAGGQAGRAAPASETDGTRVCTTIVGDVVDLRGERPHERRRLHVRAVRPRRGAQPLAARRRQRRAERQGRRHDGACGRHEAASVKVVGHKVTLTWKNPADRDFDHVVITASDAQAERQQGRHARLLRQGHEGHDQARGRSVALVRRRRLRRRRQRLGARQRARRRGAGEPVRAGAAREGARQGAPQLAASSRARSTTTCSSTPARSASSSAGPRGHALRAAARQARRASTYTWYVWPGLGAKAKAHYGKLIGKNVFTFTG